MDSMQRPSATDVALTVVGLLLGASVALGGGLWVWVRSCERRSERGFGED